MKVTANIAEKYGISGLARDYHLDEDFEASEINSKLTYGFAPQANNIAVQNYPV